MADAQGRTQQLSQWIASVKLADIPEEIITRAKYLILDGIACGLIGAHLPWSEKAVHGLGDLEPSQGDTNLIGWSDTKVTALTAALLNSSFIQGFELDDWHSEAPLHSNSIILPALLAATQRLATTTPERPVNGRDFLLAAITGYEVGPRVGKALHGAHILSEGWHSGAVFGPSASAASVSKLLQLDAGQIEDALGIACTQACGLMSAQFESDVKRMQHGFAARSGLMATFLARRGYVGIKQVYERSYGGFLKQFSSGNGKDPQYMPDELIKGLGGKWQTDLVRIKPYAAMAATHPTVDCVRAFSKDERQRMGTRCENIARVDVTMSSAAFHHGGWEARRPLTTVGAQMSCVFVAATQFVHGEVLAAQFRHDALEDDRTWVMADLIHCKMSEEADFPFGRQIMTVQLKDGNKISHQVEAARGVQPPLSNDEIVAKWRSLTQGIAEEAVLEKIETMVLSLDQVEDVGALCQLLSTNTKNPIE